MAQYLAWWAVLWTTLVIQHAFRTRRRSAGRGSGMIEAMNRAACYPQCAFIILAWLSLSSSVQASAFHSGKWPLLSGRVGPYSGVRTVKDIHDMAADGLNLTTFGSVDPKL